VTEKKIAIDDLGLLPPTVFGPYFPNGASYVKSIYYDYRVEKEARSNGVGFEAKFP
jgi:hypothetical protein